MSYTVAVAHFPPDPDFGDLAARFNVRDTFKRLTWDLTTNFKPTEDMLLFAKVATGFRSGGFPVGTTNVSRFLALTPEKVTSYEVGFKSEWLGRTLRVNGGAYILDYKDQQVQQANPTGPGLILSNAASSRIKGAEIEVEIARGGGFNLHGSLGYTDAKYKDYLAPVPGVGMFQLKGNQLPYAAKWTAAFGCSFEIPVGELKLTLSNDWTYRSRIYFDSFNISRVGDRAQLVGDAGVGLSDADGAWKLAAYVQNLTNREIKAFAFDVGYVASTIYAPRRTWGLRADFAF